MPKISAALSPDRLVFTLSSLARSVAALVIGAMLVASCNETSAPILRYPLLDEVGQSDWQTVSAGAEHTCGLKTDGTAFCWGSNQYGPLGAAHVDTVCTNTSTTYPCASRPSVVTTSLKFTSVSAGQRHSCGITTNLEAYCWGANAQGQIGSAASTAIQNPLDPSTIPRT